MLILLLLLLSVFKNTINKPSVNPENKAQSPLRVAALYVYRIFFLQTVNQAIVECATYRNNWFMIFWRYLQENQAKTRKFSRQIWGKKMRKDLKVSGYYSTPVNYNLELSSCALQLQTRHIFTINTCILNDHISRQGKIHHLDKAATVLYL